MLRNLQIFSALVAAPLLALALSTASADTLRVGNTVYDDVYVLETDTLFYVSVPSDGSVLSIRKAENQTFELARSDDAERGQLYANWKAARKMRAPAPDFEIQAILKSAATKRSAPRGDLDQELNVPLKDVAEDGHPILRLKGVRMEDDPDLQAAINDNINRMRGISPGANEPVPYASASPRTGRLAFAGGGAAGAGGGRAGAVGGFGGGGQGGGGQGGGGQGGGGQGGGGQNGGGGGFQNISDLFGTIDDLSVGEFPNPFAQFGGGGQGGGGFGGGGGGLGGP